MWIMIYRKYADSKWATVISFIAMLLRYAGIVCFVDSAILPGIILLILGIGGHFLAEFVAGEIG